MTDEQRRKNRCRGRSITLKKRGKLIPMPCKECGITKAEMHHPDYDDPANVVWLCRYCHAMLHLGKPPYGKIALTDLLDSAMQSPRSAYFGSKRLVEA